MVELAGIELIVQDMAASLAFYRRLGIDIPANADEESHVAVNLPNGVELSFDTTDFTVWGFDPNWKQGSGAINTLQCVFPSREAVDATYADLVAAGYVGHLAPHDPFWGGRYAIVNDPDGNAVAMQGPPEPDRRHAPPTKFSE